MGFTLDPNRCSVALGLIRTTGRLLDFRCLTVEIERELSSSQEIRARLKAAITIRVRCHCVRKKLSHERHICESRKKINVFKKIYKKFISFNYSRIVHCSVGAWVDKGSVFFFRRRSASPFFSLNLAISTSKYFSKIWRCSSMPSRMPSQVHCSPVRQCWSVNGPCRVLSNDVTWAQLSKPIQLKKLQ